MGRPAIEGPRPPHLVSRPAPLSVWTMLGYRGRLTAAAVADVPVKHTGVLANKKRAAFRILVHTLGLCRGCVHAGQPVAR